ncbi:MAG: hypothetical protein AB7G28_02055 [Pirellulales bacterium]
MAENLADETPVDGPHSKPEQLRFRLWHLFLLMAVMAIVLTITAPNQFPRPGLSDDSPLHLVFSGLVVFGSILTAAALTAAGLGLYGRRHGQRFLDQPGHWLVLEMAIAAAGATVIQLAFRLLVGSADVGTFTSPSPKSSTQTSPAFALLIGFGLLSLLCLIAIIILNVLFGRKQSERRWRWIFYLKALSPFLWIPGMAILLICLVRAVRVDRRENVTRDAAHYCGIILLFLSTLLLLASTVLSFTLFWQHFP